ncbi:MAG: FadR family transcriptional regulator [Deltaproteobacteria bacterium]|nr:FadR family transcriptional regulator [Deltaproteobacteria bacterium]MBW2193119.1 FadR family transcriptional regulator [Deltaproteobacteria bacterium]
MLFETIHKSSAPEKVVAQILQKVKEGELLPGARLPSQRELAQIMGVGRSSVREAINALVVMGYLESIHGKGTFICKALPAVDLSSESFNAALKAGSIFDLMEAREVLECKSAELAAERAEPAQIKKVKNVLKRVKATEKNYSIFLQADIDFHTCLAEATGNIIIYEMTKLMLDKLTSYHSRLKTRKLSPEYRRFSTHSAKMVVHHVENGEGQEASAWMVRHLNAINEELKSII